MILSIKAKYTVNEYSSVGSYVGFIRISLFLIRIILSNSPNNFETFSIFSLSFIRIQHPFHRHGIEYT
uniref:Uncharacterized protein n=2 Tax=environmental samples TaxID=371948 RepID=B3T8N2_9ARCH|nr:hypothetical protein ALOHA_HF4000APKG3D24ctg3g10 [uncultured marine crenarchaeote HF4000_APKG3D24]ABZ08941.1 hypothetical protein ALOHA_HF4000APKG5N21ctg4g14 [uncultured marine crenarchaeote HF4000_APKG5N21]